MKRLKAGNEEKRKRKLERKVEQNREGGRIAEQKEKKMGERERERGRDIINITEERERNCKECRESAREENTG